MCLLPQWWENATGLCCVRFGHWHGFHGNAADCLGLDRPIGRNQKIRGKTGVGCVRNGFMVFNILGKLRSELNLDIGILGGGFKYFLGSPLFGEDSHFD